MPLNTQQAVEAEADVWQALWTEDGGPYTLQWPEQMGPRPPQPIVQELIAVCKTFPIGTGLGWDCWHPRALCCLPDDLLDSLVKLLMAAEAIGQWPRSLALVVIAMLPKSDGGMRPIGLFPTLIRVWMRLRRKQCVEWESKHHREFMYAGKGKGSDVAAFKVAARAEAAVAGGEAHGLSFIDLAKCFDLVPRDFLVLEAVALNYCLYTLPSTPT